MSVGTRELDSEPTEWVRAHEALSRLAKERAAVDAEEGRWLLAALRSAAHAHLGFTASLSHCALRSNDLPCFFRFASFVARASRCSSY